MKIFTRKGYILAWGDLPFGDDVTAEEYNALLDIIRNKPSAESGFDYRLKADLSWELYELPPMPDDDDELSAEEALAIITGGASDD